MEHEHMADRVPSAPFETHAPAELPVKAGEKPLNTWMALARKYKCSWLYIPSTGHFE